MTLTVGERMSKVRTKNTGPELEIRRLLSSHGVRYRLHRKDLPGKPDLYLARLRLAIFVNGCFWHGHDNCKRASLPKSNAPFWAKKIAGNIERDERVMRELQVLGIETLFIWTCESKAFEKLCSRVAQRWTKAQRPLSGKRSNTP